jgi:WD40 repeat protein
VLLWDVQANVVRQTLPHPGTIWSVSMSPDTRYIATLDATGIVKTWAWNGWVYQASHTLGQRRQLAFVDAVQPMAFTPDNRRLVVAAGWRQLGIYDLLTGCEVGSLPLSTVPWGCQFTPNGDWLSVGQGWEVIYFQATPLSEADR